MNISLFWLKQFDHLQRKKWIFVFRELKIAIFSDIADTIFVTRLLWEGDDYTIYEYEQLLYCPR